MIPEMIITVANCDIECDTPKELPQVLVYIPAIE